MKALVKNCLDYLEGNDSARSLVEQDGLRLKAEVSQWNWELNGNEEKSLELINNVFLLILLDTCLGDAEITQLKTVALGQLSVINLSSTVSEKFINSLDARLRPYSAELYMLFDDQDLDSLLPQVEVPNVISFKRAPQTFIDSYYSMAAHSGLEVASSPVPSITLSSGHELSCAFPDPNNFCRIWFELRMGDDIAPNVIKTIRVGDAQLDLSAGEGELQLNKEQLNNLLEGCLEFTMDMMMT